MLRTLQLVMLIFVLSISIPAFTAGGTGSSSQQSRVNLGIDSAATHLHFSTVYPDLAFCNLRICAIQNMVVGLRRKRNSNSTPGTNIFCCLHRENLGFKSRTCLLEPAIFSLLSFSAAALAPRSTPPSLVLKPPLAL